MLLHLQLVLLICVLLTKSSLLVANLECFFVNSHFDGRHSPSRMSKQVDWFQRVANKSVRKAVLYYLQRFGNSSTAYFTYVLHLGDAYANDTAIRTHFSTNVDTVSLTYRFWRKDSIDDRKAADAFILSNCSVLYFVRLDADDALARDFFVQIATQMGRRGSNSKVVVSGTLLMDHLVMRQMHYNATEIAGASKSQPIAVARSAQAVVSNQTAQAEASIPPVTGGVLRMNNSTDTFTCVHERKVNRFFASLGETVRMSVYRWKTNFMSTYTFGNHVTVAEKIKEIMRNANNTDTKVVSAPLNGIVGFYIKTPLSSNFIAKDGRNHSSDSDPCDLNHLSKKIGRHNARFIYDLGPHIPELTTEELNQNYHVAAVRRKRSINEKRWKHESKSTKRSSSGVGHHLPSKSTRHIHSSWHWHKPHDVRKKEEERKKKKS